MQLTVVLVLVSTALVQGASKLPTWVTACYRDDPDFDACALKNGQACIPRLVQGERKLQLPVLEPMAITELRVDKGATNLGLEVLMTNLTLVGLSGTKLTKFHVDFKKQHFSFSSIVPHMELLHTYDVMGKILILPITGHGFGNVTLKGTSLNYDVDFELFKKQGKDHMRLINDKLTFETMRAHIKLDNLFNGDKLLGENMNLFMNEHWRELVTEVGPAISEALGSVFTSIFRVLASHVPYDDIVPLRPKP